MNKTKAQQAYHTSMRKLTPEQRTLARQLRNQTPRPTIDQLALRFGISHSAMFKVLHTTD